DGYTAAQQIRQNLHLDTPIVAMTAHALAGEREKCISYGMNDYISKPIKETALLKIITQFIPPLAATEKNDNKNAGNAYKYIKLQYMQDISNGNAAYEKTVTEQFIELVTDDLQALETAWQIKDANSIRQIAHNMKTTVSVMGLTDDLQSYLDTLENESFNEATCRKSITAVNQICSCALEEARIFYSTL
ncbi:MAG TPA: response regulator, partial [Chitinophagaceae bacterium]|nr:response regulator [Chitinophagaceae bacterium]